jgi:hypothetical protein
MLFVDRRRVPLPHHNHGCFSFLAPLELTSQQVNVPVHTFSCRLPTTLPATLPYP